MIALWIKDYAYSELWKTNAEDNIRLPLIKVVINASFYISYVGINKVFFWYCLPAMVKIMDHI